MFNSNNVQLYFLLKNYVKKLYNLKNMNRKLLYRTISQTDFFIKLLLEFNLMHTPKYNKKYIFYITFIYNALNI